VEIKKFKGINNVKAEERLGKDEDGAYELREANNVDIDSTFRLKRRRGYALALAGTGSHSLWSTPDETMAFFVEDGDLKQLNADLTSTVLRSGLTPNQRMSYAEVNGDVYYTDGDINGMIRNGVDMTWGVALPVHQPTLTSVSGGMLAGDYDVAITQQRADGEESGATLAVQITLTANRGIDLTNIPVSADSDIAYINVYCTRHNGDELYFVQQLTNGTTSFGISNMHSTSPLKTQFVTPPPVGSHIEYHYGMMYVAVGDAVYYSDPYAFGHFRMASNYLQFPEDITLMGSVKNGMFFSADKTYYQHGSNPKETSLIISDDSKAIEHTLIKTDGSNIKGLQPGIALMWVSDSGVYAGGGDGKLVNLTEDTWSFSPSEVGSGLLREYNGNIQYIGLLKDNDTSANNAAIGDVATAEIVRYNV